MRLRTTVGLFCVAAGAGCLLYAAAVTGRGLLWQAEHADRFAGVEPSVVEPATAAIPPSSVPARGEALGRLRIPRAGIDVGVVEGTDRRSLSLGPGHLEGSALPGDPDNCIIAGHRDGPFGRLRSIRPGDVVEISEAAGVSRYRVETTGVVDRDDTTPLAPTGGPQLTLVTCYPFNHIGPAPQRFIVRGALIEPETRAPHGAASAIDLDRLLDAAPIGCVEDDGDLDAAERQGQPVHL